MKKKHIHKIIILIFLLVSPLLINYTQPDTPQLFEDWILLSIYRNESYKLILLNPYSLEEVDLQLDQNYSHFPAWSPDKKQIAFVRDINKLSLIPTSCVIASIDCINQVKEVTIPSAPSYIEKLSWSKDNNKISFISFNVENREVVDLRIEYIDLNTTLETVVIEGQYYNPQWGKNNTILFDSSWLWLSSEIYQYNPINKEISPLNQINNIPENLENNVGYPSYSSDGSKIVFSLFEDCEFEVCTYARIYLYDLEINQYKLITSSGRFPKWSSDGTKIIFNRVNVLEDALYYYDLEKEEINKIKDLDGDYIQYDWGA